MEKALKYRKYVVRLLLYNSLRVTDTIRYGGGAISRTSKQKMFVSAYILFAALNIFVDIKLFPDASRKRLMSI